MKHLKTLSNGFVPAPATSLLELAQIGTIFGTFATAFTGFLGGINVWTQALERFVNVGQDKASS